MDFTPTRLHRDVLRLTGPDIAALLQGLLTVDVMRLEAGTALYGALLTPQGKILETMFLFPAGDQVLIDLPRGRGAGFAAKLDLYKLRAKVDIETVPDVAVVAYPALTDAPGSALAAVPDPRLGDLGARAVLPGQASLPREEDSFLDRQAALGVPDLGAGFEAADAFPLDVNLDRLGGIDHKKGCFVGQEVASRMFRKTDIRKRSWIVTGPRLAAGERIRAGETTVGEIAYLRGEVGLARVRLDRLEGESGPFVSGGEEVTLDEPDYLR